MAWDTEWAAERASETLRYLAEHYPEAAAAPELYEHQEGAHQAAVEGDREAYLDALGSYIRCGRDVALEKRRSAA